MKASASGYHNISLKIIEKMVKFASLHSTFWRRAKGSREAVNEEPLVLHICFCSLWSNSVKQAGAPALTRQQYSMLGSVVDLYRYRVTFSKSKLHRMNQNSSFLEGSFSNRDNFKVPIQLRKESQSQYLKRRSHQ